MSRIVIPLTAEEQERLQMRGDALLAQLRGVTPDQAAQWIETNVTSLASAKTVLKALARYIVWQARREGA